MKVFIDTEFTDLLEPVLISLALVTERSHVDPVALAAGTSEAFCEELYIEVPYPDHACTPFVREAVLPLLGPPDAFCQLGELRTRILNWLSIVRRDDEKVVICVDYDMDWYLFSEALNSRVPDWISHLNIDRNINILLNCEFYEKSRLPRHHAMQDARANKYAYRPWPDGLLDTFLKMEFR